MQGEQEKSVQGVADGKQIREKGGIQLTRHRGWDEQQETKCPRQSQRYENDNSDFGHGQVLFLSAASEGSARSQGSNHASEANGIDQQDETNWQYKSEEEWVSVEPTDRIVIDIRWTVIINVNGENYGNNDQRDAVGKQSSF